MTSIQPPAEVLLAYARGEIGAAHKLVAFCRGRPTLAREVLAREGIVLQDPGKRPVPLMGSEVIDNWLWYKAIYDGTGFVAERGAYLRDVGPIVPEAAWDAAGHIRMYGSIPGRAAKMFGAELSHVRRALRGWTPSPNTLWRLENRRRDKEGRCRLSE